MKEIKNIELLNSLNSLTLKNPMIIPTNISENDSEYLVFENSTVSISKLLREKDFNIDIFQNGKENVYEDNRSIDWIIPTILITSGMIIENPLLVSFLTNIISSFVYDIFKGKNKDPKVKTKIIYKDEEQKRYFQCEYEGPNSGLGEINKILGNFNG